MVKASVRFTPLLRPLGQRGSVLRVRIESGRSLITFKGPVRPGDKKLREEMMKKPDGKLIYAGLCAACHQPTGTGLEGLAPPLVDSDWVLGPAGGGALLEHRHDVGVIVEQPRQHVERDHVPEQEMG